MIGAVCAAPVDDSQSATILRSENENSGLGEYRFGCVSRLPISMEIYNVCDHPLLNRFETSDGITRDESGVLKNAGTDTEALSVRGSITWLAPDGQTYTITFVADENGYQPEGAHIPK